MERNIIVEDQFELEQLILDAYSCGDEEKLHGKVALNRNGDVICKKIEINTTDFEMIWPNGSSVTVDIASKFGWRK